MSIALQTPAGAYFAFLYQHVLAVCGEIGRNKVRATENMRAWDRSLQAFEEGKKSLLCPHSTL